MIGTALAVVVRYAFPDLPLGIQTGVVTPDHEVTAAQLAAGEKVQVTGFGIFEVKEREARVGRNPLTGEAIQIAASRTPAFKPGKALKDSVAK